ncbi:MAG: helix-turn-helix domain-containing protein [Planctomycetes bacterium]|nr:helix-turn-helix domain-containing protein [Planctomycetota bacterium]
MSTISIAEKKMTMNDGSKPRSGYMTTTELATLCGVSRFTIINWAKHGRIKTIRTVGRHYRIPVSEALSLLRSFGEKKKASSSDSGGHCRKQTPTTNGDEECGNCLTGNEKINKQIKAKKKKVLYAFGYGVGRGVHALKGRSKVK